MRTTASTGQPALEVRSEELEHGLKEATCARVTSP
jgi:hypothetical protein